MIARRVRAASEPSGPLKNRGPSVDVQIMPAPALLQFPIVTDTNDDPANDAACVGTPIERSEVLSLWDVFEALQDSADELGATEQEADELVVAAYYEVQHSLVPAPGSEVPDLIAA